MQTVFVTGGAGFIGSHLVERLLDLNYKVICLDNFDNYYDPQIKYANISPLMDNKNFKFIFGDILDTYLMNKIFINNNIDIVIHLAAKAGVRPSLLNPGGYFRTNVLGTINILECCKKYCVDKLLFASSSSIYGNNKKVPFAENDFTDMPISPYAASKKSSELICYSYHHLYKINIFGFRFFTVYGPRQRPEMAIAHFAESISKDLPIILFDGDGSTARDYTYITDIINGITNSMSRVKGFEIFNLGGSHPVKLMTLIELLQENLEKKALISFAERQPGDVECTFADISKSKKILNYNPQIDIEEGITRYCNWLKKRKPIGTRKYERSEIEIH